MSLSHYQLHQMAAFFDEVADRSDSIIDHLCATYERSEVGADCTAAFRASQDAYVALEDYCRGQVDLLVEIGINKDYLKAIVEFYTNKIMVCLKTHQRTDTFA